MTTCRYVIPPSALRRLAPKADGFALPWTTVVSGVTDGRKTRPIRGTAQGFNDIFVRLTARSPAPALVHPFKSP